MYITLDYRMLSWIVVWVTKIKKLFPFNCIYGFFTDAVVLLS